MGPEQIGSKNEGGKESVIHLGTNKRQTSYSFQDTMLYKAVSFGLWLNINLNVAVSKYMNRVLISTKQISMQYEV